MAQNWTKRSFGWIVDDFRNFIALFKARETWILLGMIAVFAVLIYYGFRFALQFDFMLRLRNMTANACKEMGNSATAVLFFGLVFMALAITMVFGEFARHLDFKRRSARALARSAAVSCGGWTIFALFLGTAMLAFLQSQCI